MRKSIQANLSLSRYLFNLLLLIGLSVNAQTYIVDSSFSPTFDIRNNPQNRGQVSDILEIKGGSQLFLTGDFSFLLPGQSHSELTLINRDGGQVSTFTGALADGGHLFTYNNSIYGVVGGLGNINFYDTTGALRLLNLRNNYRLSCRCGSIRTPYIYPDGSILASNSFGNGPLSCAIVVPPDTFPHRYLIKVDNNGIWDSSFVKDANNVIRYIFPYDSNRLILVGNPRDFTHYDGVRVNGICRIFLNGELDTTFVSPIKDTLAINAVRYLGLDNEKMLLAGYLQLKGVSSERHLVRINADGSLDSSFFNNTLFTHNHLPYGGISSFIKTKDNGYIIAGSFNGFQNTVKNHIAKIDSNGFIETQYFTSVGPDSSLQFSLDFPQIAIEESSLGGIYVYGDFRYWDGNPTQPIIRLIENQGTGIDEYKAYSNDFFKIYPNPTSDKVGISNQHLIQQIRLFSKEGKLLNILPIKDQILLPENPGLYMINLELNNGQTITKKVVKY